MTDPLITFHANFKKVSGPLITGETQVSFDIPELFENEIEGIVRLLKRKNLLIKIYEIDEAEDSSVESSISASEYTFSP